VGRTSSTKKSSPNPCKTVTMFAKWTEFERAYFNTCEPDVAGLIVHPAETVSALAYLVAAVVVWQTRRSVGRKLPVRLFPLILVVIAATSALFHASSAAVFQQLDLIAVLLLTNLLFVTSLAHIGYITLDMSLPLFFGLSVSSSLLTFFQTGLGFLIATLESLAIIRFWHCLPRKTRLTKRRLRMIICLVTPGAILLVLGHARIGCVTNDVAAHIFQPHVFWHILSAICCVLIAAVEQQFELQWRTKV